MDANERVAVLTALKKAVGRALEDARREVDEGLAEAYETGGFEKQALRVGGYKVGEIVLKKADEGYAVTDAAAFDEFALRNGLAHEERRIRPAATDSVISVLRDALDDEAFGEAVETRVVPNRDWDAYFRVVSGEGGDAVVMDGTGEVVPGVVHYTGDRTRTMVRGCDPADVLPKVAELSGAVDALALGDGD